MRGFRALVAVASSLAAAVALAAERPRCTLPHPGDWREYRSPHFAVTSDVSRGTALSLVRELETTRALILQALFGEQVEIPGRVRVLAFGEPRHFRNLAGEGADAYIMRGSGAPMVVLAFEGSSVSSSFVAHELAHHVSWYLYPRQPQWFSEGLAEFIGSVGTERPEATAPIGSNIIRSRSRGGGRWAGLARPEMVSEAQLDIVPLRELLAWNGGESRSDWPRQHISSWALYHWLWNERSNQLTAFQERLSRGDDPGSAWRAAFPEYDPARPETLVPADAALNRYVKLGSYAAYRVDVRAPDVAVAEAPVASADLHMLLLEARRSWPKDREQSAALVRAEVEETLREDPAHPVAITRRGGTRADMVAALRAATQARPGDARAWLRLGTALDDGDAREREAALRKAVALDPDGAEAHNALAWFLAESGRAREARPFADRALDLAPWDPYIVDTLAAVAMKIGQCKAAVQLQRRAADHFASDEERGSSVRKRLAEYEAACGAEAPRPR